MKFFVVCVAVALDRVLVAQRRVVRIEAGPLARAALTQEVPVLVELDANALQTRVLLGSQTAALGVRLQQPVLLSDKLLYVVADARVVHGPQANRCE